MIFTKYSNTLRWVIIIASFAIVSLILWKTFEFFQHFKEEERIKMENWSFAQTDIINSDTNANLDYIFEPSKVEIVEQLIPKSLKTQLFKGIRDSFASEHGARMTAMHKATDNATELRNQLKLTYNKARQAAITNEILEIVGGAEALKG